MFRRYSRGLVRILSSVAALCLLIPAAPTAGQQPPQQQAPLPTARDVIDRSIEASGGAKAFKAVKSMRARGTVAITDQKLTGDVEVLTARPNKVITRATIGGIGKIEEAFDGKIAWSIDPVTGPALVSGKALTERADEAWFDAPLHAADYVREMTVVGRETFDKRPAYRVKVVLLSGLDQTEYFDVETGFQIGLEVTRETPFGSVPTRTMFRDHKKFGALMLPTSQVQSVLISQQVVTLTSYEFDVVPATAFDVPAVIKALIK